MSVLKIFARSFVQQSIVLQTSLPFAWYEVLYFRRQDEYAGQRTYNVTLRRVSKSLLPRKVSKYYLLVCVRMRARACVCARECTCGYPGAWAYACAYVHVTLLIHDATRMRHIVTWFVAPRSPPYFFECAIFRRKGIEHKMCVSIFSTTFV